MFVAGHELELATFGHTHDASLIEHALSSTLTSLGMLQPWAFGSLNHVDPLDSVSNYHLVMQFLVALYTCLCYFL